MNNGQALRVFMTGAEVVLAVLVMLAFWSAARNAAQNPDYKKTYLSSDLAALLDASSSLAGSSAIPYQHPFLSLYDITIAGETVLVSTPPQTPQEQLLFMPQKQLFAPAAGMEVAMHVTQPVVLTIRKTGASLQTEEGRKELPEESGEAP